MCYCGCPYEDYFGNCQASSIPEDCRLEVKEVLFECVECGYEWEEEIVGNEANEETFLCPKCEGKGIPK